MSISDEQIEEAAQAPRKVETDEGSVTEKSVSELIEAQKHTASNKVGTGPFGGFKPFKVTQGSALW